MNSIKAKKSIVITLLMIMQFSVAAQGVDYFRAVDGVSHLPIFADTAAVPESKEDGALVFSTADGRPMVYSGTDWKPAGSLWTISGSDIYYDTGNVGIGTASPEVGIHGYNLNRGTGNYNDIGAVVQMSAPSDNQAGMLVAGDSEQDDVWLALRPQISHANQWMIGARFCSGSAFNIGYGTHDGTMTYPQGTGSKFIILTNGNVGIGTTNPNRAKLVVSGSVIIDNGAYGYLTSNGTTGMAGGPVYTSIYASDRTVCSEFNAISDRRIKENITEWENALETISELRVVGYNKLTKNGSAMGELGLIGQELIEVFPLAVRVSPGDVPNETGEWEEVDDFHAVNYQSVFMLAIRGIQEQQGQIEDLKSENTELRSKVDTLESLQERMNARLTALENR